MPRSTLRPSGEGALGRGASAVGYSLEDPTAMASAG